jgi:hypothetical protein
MLNKFSVVVLLVVVLSVTACGQIQLPNSLPQLPSLTQPNSASDPSTSTTQDTLPKTSPSDPSTLDPQATKKQVRGAPGIAAFLQVFHQLGWEAGVVAKASSDQIGLRTVQNGPDKIAVGTSTIFIIPGKSNANISDIHVGARIIADVPNDQTTAALVMSVPKDYDKDNVLLGQVKSNSNGLVTLRAPGGLDTLTTNGASQVIRVLREGIALGSVSDLQGGVLVAAIGQSTRDEFVGQAVFALPKGVLELGRKLGGEKRNPPPPALQPGN